MELRDKLLQAKEEGLTIKFIAKKINIAESTLYAFSCGVRELSTEKAEKLNSFLDLILSF